MRTKISTQYIQVLKMSIMSCSDFLKVLSMAMNLSVCRFTYTLDMKDIIDEQMSCYLSLPMKKLYKVKENQREIFISFYVFPELFLLHLLHHKHTKTRPHNQEVQEELEDPQEYDKIQEHKRCNFYDYFRAFATRAVNEHYQKKLLLVFLCVEQVEQVQ